MADVQVRVDVTGGRYGLESVRSRRMAVGDSHRGG